MRKKHNIEEVIGLSLNKNIFGEILDVLRQVHLEEYYQVSNGFHYGKPIDLSSLPSGVTIDPFPAYLTAGELLDALVEHGLSFHNGSFVTSKVRFKKVQEALVGARYRDHFMITAQLLKDPNWRALLINSLLRGRLGEEKTGLKIIHDLADHQFAMNVIFKNRSDVAHGKEAARHLFLKN